MALVQPADLSAYLQRSVPDAAAAMAVRVAEGWLRAVIPGTTWPNPVPEDLWAWALELASIAYSNPTGERSRTVLEDATEWNLERRAEILAAAGARYGGARPLAHFPPPGPAW